MRPMEFIWDGLATIGLTTLLLLVWVWCQGDDDPPAPPLPRPSTPSGPSWPPPTPGVAGHEAVLRQAATTQWEQDEALLVAARQMLGVMQACQADGGAAAEKPTAEGGATVPRRRAGCGAQGGNTSLSDGDAARWSGRATT